ncbi:MAG: glycosyltransferase family 4 protein [Chloroflexi bacterium]|nr:glycosyltransferase family 4 protein [Chloroflexota bacterium]
MHLLHVNAAYKPFIGGAEVYTQTISERFVRDRHAVKVVTTDAVEVEYFWHPHRQRTATGTETLNGVEITRCAVKHLPLAPWSFYLLRRLTTGLATWSSSGRLLPVFRFLAPLMPSVPELEATLSNLEGPIDIVHGVNIALEWPLLAAWHFARSRGAPFVTTPFVHVGQHGRSDVVKHYVMPHQLEALRDAEAVIVQTDIEKRALAELGISEDRLHRLGMGVDLASLEGGSAQRFRARHTLDGSIVTFLGVVTYDKGSFHLVQAMQQIWEQDARVHLVIAGPCVGQFERFYRRLPTAVRDRILLLGPVVGQEKLDLLAATDVFALPSRIDSFGIVYLEAWAYCKPVIGAHAGGVPDVISDGVDGVLVEFGDVAGLAGAIQRLLGDPAYRERLGRSGRAKVERQYTWDTIYTRLSALYERLLD